MRDFGQFSAHLPTLCPLLKTKPGSEKPSVYAGLRGFCPLSHLFLLFNCDKKIKKIYK